MFSAYNALRGAAAELACTTGSVVRWSGGFGAELPVSSPAAQAARRGPAPYPVLLVHGLCANKSYWRPLERRLLAEGYTVCSVNYRWLNSTVAACGAHVADDADRLLAATGAEKLHVIAHSLGGVVTKWAVHHTGLGEVVDTAISLGSPHQGAPLAGVPAGRFVPALGSLISELRPGHRALREQAWEVPAHIRWATVGGAMDALVPAPYAALPTQPADHTTFGYLGHISMVTDRRVIDVVKRELAAREELRLHAA